MTVEGNNERLEREPLDSTEDKELPQEEITANYWKWVEHARKIMNELQGNLLRAKCVFKQYILSNEIAERPSADMIGIEHSLTGRRTLIVEFIDLDSRDAYEEWKAESDREPTIIKPGEQFDG